MTPTDAATTSEMNGRLEVVPLLMMRIAALPLEYLSQVRTPETSRWARECLDLEHLSADAAELVADRLHDILPLVADTRARRDVLEVRRRAFRNEIPRAVAVDCVKDAAPQVAHDLDTWLALRSGLARARESGPGVLDVELRSGRAALRQLAEHPRLRSGIMLSAPQLDLALDAFCNDEITTMPAKRVRRTERSLLEYFYRSASKASPFAAFGGLALGRLTSQSCATDIPEVSLNWSDFPRLNVVVLQRLADALFESAAYRPGLPIRLAAGVDDQTDLIRYVRRTRRAGDDDRAVSFDSTREDLLFLQKSALVRQLVRVLRTDERLTYGVAIERLDAGGEDAAELDHFLRAVVNLGLVQVPLLEIDVHSDDPLRTFAQKLGALDEPWAGELAGKLESLALLVESYRVAGLAERRQIHATLGNRCRTLMTEIGGAERALPRTLLYEDCRVQPDVVPIAARPLADGLHDAISRVADILPALSALEPDRLVLKGFFLARFGIGGRCDDIALMVRHFHEDIYSEYRRWASNRTPFQHDGAYTPHVNWLRQDELVALDQARVSLRDAVALAVGECADAEQVIVPDLMFTTTREMLPATATNLRTFSCFLQPVGTDGTFVLNQVHGGVLFPFTRFTHLFGEQVPHAEDRAALLFDGGQDEPLFAEVTGGSATSNLNLHRRLTRHEIVCPGDLTAGAPEAQLPLGELMITHDADTDRLTLRRKSDGRTVLPVYLGYLVQHALPEIASTLLLLAASTSADLDLWDGVPEVQLADDVRYRPRLRTGNLVLSRRSWTVSTSSLPDAGESDSETFLTWQRWRLARGIPERTYAQIISADRDGVPGRASKPRLVDFDSWFSVALLAAGSHPPGSRVRFSEALPDTTQPVVTSAEGSHVAELVVEFTGRPAGRRQQKDET